MCLGELVQVTAVDAEGLWADDRGRTVRVSALTLDATPEVGQWLLVHAGFALARLEPEEAATARGLRGDDETRQVPR
ncbi:HypC/HybG/HupF family hydrogenase formation chaperone [Actinotalea sp.]|uniref:HypC/HybG/HupF family hydrogenase formation chaperone n=1 Tax=Actinotalea sp. TaxID=1872145 RepID=UPI0035672C74